MRGPLERAIRQRITEGERMYTPSKGAPFKLRTIDDKGIVLLFGKKETPTRLSWECLEGIPPFLQGKDWVNIGTSFDTKGTPNTLDEYLKKSCIKRATASWVAVVLKKAGIVEIDPGRPLRARLKPSQ